MARSIEFTYTAAKWILDNRDWITEDVIVNVVKDFPESERIALSEKDCFLIEFRRKKRAKLVQVVAWVHEYPYRFLVYKLHHY